MTSVVFCYWLFLLAVPPPPLQAQQEDAVVGTSTPSSSLTASSTSRSRAVARVQELTSCSAYWCLRALVQCGDSVDGAVAWLNANTSAITAVCDFDAPLLAQLGVSSDAAKRLSRQCGCLPDAVAAALATTSLDAPRGSFAAGAAAGVSASTGTATAGRLHPGTFRSGSWTCCKAGAIHSPYCTSAPRTSGAVSAGDRVMRGPGWQSDYGNQDGGGFGTVVHATTWNGLPDCGVRVKWDTGDFNVYRWGHSGKYDVQVICDVVNPSGGSGTAAAASVTALTSSTVNPGYQVVDDTATLYMSSGGGADATVGVDGLGAGAGAGTGASGAVSAGATPAAAAASPSLAEGTPTLAPALSGAPSSGGGATAHARSWLEQLQSVSKRQLLLITRDTLSSLTALDTKVIASLVMQSRVASDDKSVSAMLSMLAPADADARFLTPFLLSFPVNLRSVVGPLASDSWGTPTCGVRMCVHVRGHACVCMRGIARAWSSVHVRLCMPSQCHNQVHVYTARFCVRVALQTR